MSALISASDLRNKIASGDDVVLLDATYGAPVNYTIAGAHHFDIDVVADQTNLLPHMIPTVNEFEHHVQNMGINHNSEIVIFDKSGFWMAAARVWWMFRLFGHSNVKVLDGGLQAWDGELAPYSPSTHAKGDFESNFQSHLYKSYDDIVSNDDSFTLVDARPTQAYDAGSISNSISIPIPSLITPNACLKTKEELAGILSPALSLSMPLTTTCGSGVTACALALSLYECGKQEVSVFDGSWIEWSSK